MEKKAFVLSNLLSSHSVCLPHPRSNTGFDGDFAGGFSGRRADFSLIYYCSDCLRSRVCVVWLLPSPFLMGSLVIISPHFIPLPDFGGSELPLDSGFA